MQGCTDGCSKLGLESQGLRMTRIEVYLQPPSFNIVDDMQRYANQYKTQMGGGGTNVSFFGYDRLSFEFDFGFEELYDTYLDSHMFQTALEKSRNEENYFSTATLLALSLLDEYAEERFKLCGFEEQGPLYLETIDCYRKCNKDVYAAEVMLRYSHWIDNPFTPLGIEKCFKPMLEALQIFEREGDKRGIFRVSNSMSHGTNSTRQELERIEEKYDVQFSQIHTIETLSWNHRLSKLGLFVGFLLGFFLLQEEQMLMGALTALTIITLIITDLTLLRREKKKIIEKYTRFFEWLD